MNRHHHLKISLAGVKEGLIPLRMKGAACDEAETATGKAYWPFPTYDELLFSVK